MKRLASAITLSIASIVAMAADPQVGEQASLVLAYNQPAISSAQDTVETVSREQAEQVMTQTLGMVSAKLTYRLNSQIAEKVTARVQ